MRPFPPACAALLVAALLPVAAPAGAAPAGPRAAEIARTPDHARYTAALTSDAAGVSWTGTESVTFRNAGSQPLPEVYLRLWDNWFGKKCDDPPIKVSKVTGGTAGAPEVACTALKITLPKPLGQGEEATIGFDLSITVPDGLDRFGRSAGYVYLGNALPVLAVNDEAGWHLDPFTNGGESFYQLISDYTVTLDHPTGNLVPATGTSVEKPGASGRTVTTATATNVREFAWASGAFKHSSTTSAGGVKINTLWSSKVSDSTAAAMQKTAATAIDGHGQRYGAYPYGEVDVLLDTGYPFGGMEYPGIIFDIPQDMVVTHELAHQWFYGIVGDDEYRHPWLDEAFTDYATDIQRNIKGDNCWSSVRFAEAAEKLSNGMDYWDRHSSRYATVIYTYGKCALHDLRRLIGESAMADLLKSYAKDHWYGISTMPDFKAAAQKAAAGKDLTQFWTTHRIEG